MVGTIGKMIEESSAGNAQSHGRSYFAAFDADFVRLTPRIKDVSLSPKGLNRIAETYHRHTEKITVEVAIYFLTT